MASTSVSGDAGRSVPARAYWAEPVDEVLAAVASGRVGLTSDEAAARLETYGPNRLPETRGQSALVRFLSQFTNILIYVLLASAVVAAFLGEIVDAGVILGVVIANAVIGFIQEGRAERALDAIRGMIMPRASAIRDGQRVTVDVDTLVPGDIVLLEGGDRTPADLRLVRGRNLRIEEAVLTGESVPVDKGTEAVGADAVLGDRTSMAFSGTLVVAGHAAGVVVATGGSTELGKISKLLGSVETMTTPLVRQMDRFAGQLTAAILAIGVIGFGFAVLVRGYTMTDAMMAMVGLVVAAIPEGLPAVMTITLATGVQRMAKRNAVIRRLPAVETLGAVSVICSDKTGTLTRNEMTVRTVVTAEGRIAVTGVGYDPEGGFETEAGPVDVSGAPVLQAITAAALLCNDASLRSTDAGWVVEGDPMEGALVSLAIKAGRDRDGTRDRYHRLDEIPFDSRHRYMATLHSAGEGGKVIYIKGAPERVLALCTGQLGKDGPEPIDQDWWHREIHQLASDGQRILALGMRHVQDETDQLSSGDVEDGVVFLGILGMIDPPREDAIAAVEECRAAGIAVKMITGDHASTASAIGRQIGILDHDKVVTGNVLDDLDPPAFRDAVLGTAVFARTSPEHKLRIVEALQEGHGIVAMTGDGVNDAPALKRADVGVAMGRKGTEAAKEAAEMVLLDDNFASIVAAVREGRTVYDNLKKVIGWTLPTSVGEALVILAAVLVGLAMPVTPVQILWINMVTAVALGLTLAFEPTEPGAMRRPPRSPTEPLLSGFLTWRVIFVSVLFVIGAFGMFFWALERGHGLNETRTIVVNTIVVMEIFYLFSIRYLHETSLTFSGLVGTPAVLIGVGTIVIAQIIFTYVPVMHTLFGTAPVSLGDGMAIIGVGVALLVILEIEKLVRRGLGIRDR
ncbi:MAG: cation-transporting P-type ATPase [Bauldia sp.]|nr:cation-transporting P-type ATPase [Bauldia sp.]